MLTYDSMCMNFCALYMCIVLFPCAAWRLANDVLFLCFTFVFQCFGSYPFLTHFKTLKFLLYFCLVIMFMYLKHFVMDWNREMFHFFSPLISNCPCIISRNNFLLLRFLEIMLEINWPYKRCDSWTLFCATFIWSANIMKSW